MHFLCYFFLQTLQLSHVEIMRISTSTAGNNCCRLAIHNKEEAGRFYSYRRDLLLPKCREHNTKHAAAGIINFRNDSSRPLENGQSFTLLNEIWVIERRSSLVESTAVADLWALIIESVSPGDLAVSCHD